MEIDKIKLCVYRVLLKTSDLCNNMENCINFAFELIENNIESINIFILAGLDKNEYYDIKKYFFNILNELKINVDINDEQLGLEYLSLIANEVIDDKRIPIGAIRELKDYNENLFNYENPVYKKYSEFVDEIDLMLEIDSENYVEEYIKHHFELFLKIKEINIPQDIYEQAYCEKCKKRIKPKIINYRELKCPECGNNKVCWIKHNCGMDLYLNEIGIM
jgi:DNA-directed RNA polymerase subunit RPC12/RpoP